MLKIQCSVVNSSTQTNSLKKSSKGNDVESKHLSKQSFSFVETEIFSNVIGKLYFIYTLLYFILMFHSVIENILAVEFLF